MSDWKALQEDRDADQDRTDDAYINENEKQFLFEGIRDFDFRLDGRGPLDYRNIHIEVGSVNNANGSARIKLGDTNVVAAVKIALGEPEKDTPDEGIVEISVESSVPSFGNAEEDEDTEIFSTQELQQILECIYYESGGIDRKKLGVLKGSKCWTLFFDIIIFEQGSSVLEAAALAIKASLADARFPTVRIVEDELDQFEIEYSDNPYDCWQMDVACVPTIATLSKIGPVFVVDVTREERVAAEALFVVAANASGTVFYQSVDCTGPELGIRPEVLQEAVEISMKVCQEMNRELDKALKCSL
ncbi:exosome complex component RRP42-like [Paramacrobiotus metropolitanus]|uniref:exosome complex component RRP42-like n=1 Tax=Paramacrobiotus metropolitanus TaxID=2943436 RepID=UPI0024458D60|nr:exosome complex component RRP42-like [Paramacrobiotus metropolitanus]XP_055357855.1 exosome complex component RRP42-like [Paramacrobiotus metropolitanus]